jgi:hypothetical protein
MAELALQAQAQRVPQVLPAQQELLAQTVVLVLLVQQAHKVLLVFRALMEQTDHRVRQVLQEQQVQLVPLVC